MGMVERHPRVSARRKGRLVDHARRGGACPESPAALAGRFIKECLQIYRTDFSGSLFDPQLIALAGPLPREFVGNFTPTMAAAETVSRAVWSCTAACETQKWLEAWLEKPEETWLFLFP